MNRRLQSSTSCLLSFAGITQQVHGVTPFVTGFLSRFSSPSKFFGLFLLISYLLSILFPCHDRIKTDLILERKSQGWVKTEALQGTILVRATATSRSSVFIFVFHEFRQGLGGVPGCRFQLILGNVELLQDLERFDNIYELGNEKCRSQ